MRVRLSDPALNRDLIRYLREGGYLAIEEDEVVTAVLIISGSPSADRASFVRGELETWRAFHAGVEVELLEG